MTVKELIDKLKTLDEDKEIGFYSECGLESINDVVNVIDKYSVV